jgi:hypothetical protein
MLQVLQGIAKFPHLTEREKMKILVMLSIGLLSMIAVAFDPITIMIVLGSLLAAGAAFVEVVLLTIETVRGWMRENRSWNRNRMAFLIKKARHNGRIPVITGFFDEYADQVTAHKDYLAESTDSNISSLQTETIYQLT